VRHHGRASVVLPVLPRAVGRTASYRQSVYAHQFIAAIGL